jgi:hypothetical protein
MRVIFSALLLMAMGGAGAYWQTAFYGPDLWADWQIRSLKVAEPADSQRWKLSGKCEQHKFATECKIEYTDTANIKHPFTYEIGFMGSRVTANILQTAEQPARYTTDLGLENFWNRFITLAALDTIFFGMAIAGIAALLKRKAEE